MPHRPFFPPVPRGTPPADLSGLPWEKPDEIGPPITDPNHPIVEMSRRASARCRRSPRVPKGHPDDQPLTGAEGEKARDAAALASAGRARYLPGELARFLGLPAWLAAGLPLGTSEQCAPFAAAVAAFRRSAVLYAALAFGSHPTDANWADAKAALVAGDVDKLEIDPGFLGKWLALFESRIEFAGGEPVRLFPFSRGPSRRAPRLVVLDPAVADGRPTLVGRRVRTAALNARFARGATLAELATRYRVSPEAAAEAVRYEAWAATARLMG